MSVVSPARMSCAKPWLTPFPPHLWCWAVQQFLQDIALATNATFIDSELGMMLQTMTMEDLGYAASSTTTR